MTVLLVLLFFAFFVGLDYVLHYRHSRQRAPAAAELPQLGSDAPAVAVPAPVYVAGYELPDGLHYHRGHTWARVVSPDTVAVGIDDFARRLVGTPTDVRAPRRGTWVRQGGPGAEITSRDRTAHLVSPIEGEVVAVNREARHDPEVVARDPYGRGWLYKVQTAALGTGLRNLMEGTLAQRWIEDERDQLDLRLMALSGSVLQDGGEPAPDFADHLDTDEWRHLAETFLLTR